MDPDTQSTTETECGDTGNQGSKYASAFGIGAEAWVTVALNDSNGPNLQQVASGNYLARWGILMGYSGDSCTLLKNYLI